VPVMTTLDVAPRPSQTKEKGPRLRDLSEWTLRVSFRTWLCLNLFSAAAS
jgi:hypothetical protein